MQYKQGIPAIEPHFFYLVIAIQASSLHCQKKKKKRKKERRPAGCFKFLYHHCKILFLSHIQEPMKIFEEETLLHKSF